MLGYYKIHFAPCYLTLLVVINNHVGNYYLYNLCSPNVYKKYCMIYENNN